MQVCKLLIKAAKEAPDVRNMQRESAYDIAVSERQMSVTLWMIYLYGYTMNYYGYDHELLWLWL